METDYSLSIPFDMSDDFLSMLAENDWQEDELDALLDEVLADGH